MQILAIIGTPTGEDGYTTQTVQALEHALQAKGGATLDYLHLSRQQLGGCQGYLTCIKQGEQACPFSSQIDPIIAAMHEADAVIFASPVHCFNVSALMKNFFDLLVFQMHRPEFFGKAAAVVTAAAGAGQGPVLKYMSKTVGNWGFEVAARLGTHAGLFNEDRYQPKLKHAAAIAADKLLQQVASANPRRPGLADLINFRVWRSVVRRTENASPYDWRHWQQSGWLEQDYYYPVAVNPLANGCAGLLEKIIDRSIRNVSVKPLT